MDSARARSSLSEGIAAARTVPAAAGAAACGPGLPLHGGGGGPTGGGPVKCQPGAKRPTPGSEVITRPSRVTVPVPTYSHRPAAWLNDQIDAFCPGLSPSRLGNVTGAGTA